MEMLRYHVAYYLPRGADRMVVAESWIFLASPVKA